MWDRWLLLSNKYWLRGFTDAQIFLCEDLPQEYLKYNITKYLHGHLPSNITDDGGMHRNKLLIITLNKHVRIVSYNARGFQSGFTFVKELLHDCDILCLQEHCLLNILVT